MGFLDCKSCALHERHIESLLREISHLEKLVFPPKPTQVIEMVEDEATNLMNGASHEVPFDNEIAMEADRILSGELDDNEQL